MRRAGKALVALAVVGLVLGGLPVQKAEAIVFPFFIPIAECGTVGTVPSFLDLDNDGELDECTAWISDTQGAFLVAGLENFSVGDRVFVQGLICTTCLTTCAAGAIFNATLSSCP